MKDDNIYLKIFNIKESFKPTSVIELGSLSTLINYDYDVLPLIFTFMVELERQGLHCHISLEA